MNDTNPNAPQRAPDATSKPKLNRLFRLQFEPAQDAHVLLYPEGMVKLNQSAAQILLRCNGTRDIAAIVADLEQTFNATGLAPEVETFIAHAIERGWLEPSA